MTTHTQRQPLGVAVDFDKNGYAVLRSAELDATTPRSFIATRTPDAAGSAVEFTFNNVGQISAAKVTTNDTQEAARISQFIERLNAGVTARLVNSKSANYR